MAVHRFRVTLEIKGVNDGIVERVNLPLVVNMIQATRLVEDYAVAYSAIGNPFRLERAEIARVEVDDE